MNDADSHQQPLAGGELQELLDRPWRELGFEEPGHVTASFDLFIERVSSLICDSGGVSGEGARSETFRDLSRALRAISGVRFKGDLAAMIGGRNGLTFPSRYREYSPSASQVSRLSLLIDHFAGPTGESAPRAELAMVLEVGIGEHLEMWLRIGPPTCPVGLICIDRWGRAGDFSTATTSVPPRNWSLGHGCGVGPLRDLPTPPNVDTPDPIYRPSDWHTALLVAKGEVLPDLSFLPRDGKASKAWEDRWGAGFFRAVAAIANDDLKPAFLARCRACNNSLDHLYPMKICFYCSAPVSGEAYDSIRSLSVPAGWYRDPFKEKPKREWNGSVWTRSTA